MNLKGTITPTKPPLLFVTSASASLTNLVGLLRQSRDRSYYVSRRILALPPLWLHTHADPRAHDFAHAPCLWHQPWLANVTCAWSWRLCGMYPTLNTKVIAQIALCNRKILLFYPWRKRPAYILSRRLCGLWKRLGLFSEEKNLLYLKGIESLFLPRPSCN